MQRAHSPPRSATHSAIRPLSRRPFFWSEVCTEPAWLFKGSQMDSFVRNANIRLYQKLLKEEVDEEKRKLIQSLLAEETRKLGTGEDPVGSDVLRYESTVPSSDGRFDPSNHWNEGGRSDGMKNILFVCPVTNQSVQHRVKITSDADRDYESVRCLACDGIHFVHIGTGGVLRRGDE
jgi:hypothetical protein